MYIAAYLEDQISELGLWQSLQPNTNVVRQVSSLLPYKLQLRS